jgi:hypothetical protein
MNPTLSSYGMATRGHDLGDALDLLVDRSSRPQPKNHRETRAAEKAAGHKS